MLAVWRPAHDPKNPSKVAWLADSTYAGPIRIRAGQVDGSGQILLGAPDNRGRGTPVKTIGGIGFYTELNLLEASSDTVPSTRPWRLWPSSTYIASAGCYAWEVDGLDFTEVITSRA